jgi:hypothetical protein
MATIKIGIEVPSREALENLIKKLKSISDINKVYRVTHKQKMVAGNEPDQSSGTKTHSKPKIKNKKKKH